MTHPVGTDESATPIGVGGTSVLAAALYPGLGPGKRELAFNAAVTNLLPRGLINGMIAAMAALVLAASQNYTVGGSALLTRNF